MEQQVTAHVRRRVTWVLAGALVLALAPFLMWQRAEGGPVSAIAPDGIVVVGDSITARYNDVPGDADQGWWSIVGRHYGADVRRYAQSGSGYLRPGLFCEGDRFRERLGAFTGAPPSIFIIEGGRNDWATCRDGRFRPSTDAEVAAAVDQYLDLVTEMLPAQTRVVVLAPPWGPRQRIEGLRVTSIIRSAVAQHGAEFVDTTGTLGPLEVVDGIHPNRAGSLAIADRVIAAIG